MTTGDWGWYLEATRHTHTSPDIELPAPDLELGHLIRMWAGVLKTSSERERVYKNSFEEISEMFDPSWDCVVICSECVYGFVSERYSIVTVGTNHKNMSFNASISQISYHSGDKRWGSRMPPDLGILKNRPNLLIIIEPVRSESCDEYIMAHFEASSLLLNPFGQDRQQS